MDGSRVANIRKHPFHSFSFRDESQTFGVATAHQLGRTTNCNWIKLVFPQKQKCDQFFI